MAPPPSTTIPRSSRCSPISCGPRGDPMRLVVVGGGVTGLAAAHRAVELARERGIALELVLLEARERLGGTIATERAGGFLVEAGPDSVLSEKPWALALCRRLGIEDPLPPPPGPAPEGFLLGARAAPPRPPRLPPLSP